MPDKTLTVEQVLELLAAAPARIAELTSGLTPAQLRTRPAPEEWSAVEVLAHLRACSDVWGGRIERILAEDVPRIRGINPRAWMRKTNYPEREFKPSLRAYTKQRAELMETLESLPPEAWSRTAIITGAGHPLEHTVLFYGQWLASHERPHLKQIANIVAST